MKTHARQRKTAATIAPVGLALLSMSFLQQSHWTSALSTPKNLGSSRLFLDTADVGEWEELMPLGIFHGITTNPTLLERAHEECSVENLRRLRDIAFGLCDEIMVQAWGSTAEELYKCGRRLADGSLGRTVIKVPVTKVGVEAANMLIENGCRVCLTACYNTKQVVIASSVGAEYIAPYLGRMADAGIDSMTEVATMRTITENMGSPMRILVASIRDADKVPTLVASGLDTFAISPETARELFTEPLTAVASRDFMKSAARNAPEPEPKVEEAVKAAVEAVTEDGEDTESAAKKLLDRLK